MNAVEIAGREMTLDAVMQEVCKDEIFYKHSGGGVTLSGGEPLPQFNFAYSLMRQEKEKGIHTCRPAAMCKRSSCPGSFPIRLETDRGRTAQKIHRCEQPADTQKYRSNRFCWWKNDPKMSGHPRHQ